MFNLNNITKILLKMWKMYAAVLFFVIIYYVHKYYVLNYSSNYSFINIYYLNMSTSISYCIMQCADLMKHKFKCPHLGNIISIDLLKLCDYICKKPKLMFNIIYTINMFQIILIVIMIKFLFTEMKKIENKKYKKQNKMLMLYLMFIFVWFFFITYAYLPINIQWIPCIVFILCVYLCKALELDK